MGIERTVRFGDGGPAWPAVQDRLQRHGFPIQVRMIDGELSFPDEVPPEGWRELRLQTPQGMVTVVRETNRARCVIWGNADRALEEAWNAVIWAFAAAGAGTVEGDPPRTAAEFRTSAALPSCLS